MKRTSLITILLSLLMFLISEAQDVKYIGAMREVMHGAGTGPVVMTDTLAPRQGLYGIGPLAGLKGELLIIDGETLVSRATSDQTMTVKNEPGTGAPFFVYGNVNTWRPVSLPDSILTIEQIETYLAVLKFNDGLPFIFRIRAEIDRAKIHTMNVPDGTVINSPEDAHKSQVNFRLKDQNAEIIGFYSSGHKGIFTHHDRDTHMHLVTADRRFMGHVDEIALKKGSAILLLPVR